MLQAMNTGHDGSLTTLHANTPGHICLQAGGSRCKAAYPGALYGHRCCADLL
jgi:hypothetical protein